jgi:pyrroloquinoline quinone (PQQ) biosynthesis protein C
VSAVTRSFALAEWLSAEIARLREQWDVLRHPFHERWAAGELTAAELQAYASEHHHAVVALASASRRAADLANGMLAEELTRYADAQERHIELWCDFAVATGWCRSSAWYFAAEPLAQTVACARTWSGGRDRSLAQNLVTIYAIESIQSQLARVQLDALIDRYGFRDAGPTRYFRRRMDGAAGNAALAEAGLTSLLPAHDPIGLLRQAEQAYRSYWELLDGVQELSPAVP